MNLHFGETLKVLRKEKNFTQENLANFLGVSFQAVSKWERNESYPDITMLPSIAALFGVSVDKLLGIDLLENDRKIEEYINEYVRLWSAGRIDKVKELMKKATEEFPGNYALLVRYFNALISAEEEESYLIGVRNEAQTIYDTIQSHCTDDSIRIWAKKLMCRYLRDLSLIKDSGCSIEEAERILDTMPIMQNTRDYYAMYMYPHDDLKRSKACANGISEMLRLFGEIMNRKYKSFLDADDNISQAYINLLEAVMPDGDYGKSYYLMVIHLQRLGVKKFLKGDENAALENFEKAVTLARKYDLMPQITHHTSPAVEGLEFDKSKAYRYWEGSFAEDLKDGLRNRPQLTDEFKNSERFFKIMEI